MDLLIWVFVCLALAAYFAGIETAFTSFDRILVESWRRANRFGASTAHFFFAKPERFLTTSLIGTSILTVAYSVLVVEWAGQAGLSTAWVIICSPIVMLVIGEVLPKMIAYEWANLVVRYVAWPMYFAFYLFAPIRWLLFPLTRLVSKEPREQSAALRRSYFFVKDELDLILKEAEESGAASPEEGELLSRYLDARELKVRQIMTPRTQMVAVNASASIASVRDVFRKHRHSVMPVYRESLDHVVGYVRARDLLRNQDSIHSILRPILAVPESKPIVELLEEFRAQRLQVAVVIDEYGGTDGLVTIKDIFEELVGPVAERWDPQEPIIKRVAPGKFLVSGAAFLEDIAAATGWEPPAGDYTTISGLLSERLGRIADAGEDIVIEGVTIRVIQRNPRRVEGCLVKVPVHEDDEN